MDADPDVPIESVKRSYAVIDAIRERERAGVTELANALELPKSTVHNHLRTLDALGYLVRRDGTYRLSTRYLHLGRESRNGSDVFLYGREEVRCLAERSNRYCQLVVEENGRGTILLATGWHYEDLPPTARHVYPTHEHLHTNAPGKAILAHLPDDRVAEIVARHGLPERTDRTITDEAALDEARATVRERGHAVDRGEMIQGMVGVAAPIATDERVYGAVAAYGSETQMRPAIEGDLPTLVQEAADGVRADLTFAALE
ncbi:IclR family transcriptional regulator (plasmid) [Haloferacaceae archaeon DSL9]